MDGGSGWRGWLVGMVGVDGTSIKDVRPWLCQCRVLVLRLLMLANIWKLSIRRMAVIASTKSMLARPPVISKPVCHWSIGQDAGSSLPLSVFDEAPTSPSPSSTSIRHLTLATTRTEPRMV